MGSKSELITVDGISISVVKHNDEDFVSLTDMAGYRSKDSSRSVVFNWMSTHYTIDFLKVWEQVNNPDFNYMGYHVIKNAEGRLLVSVKKWVDATNAIGIYSKTGRYDSGVFAHRDIALEFGTWLSPEFKYYLILEFQRLKQEEQGRLSAEWNLPRLLSKINYRIHTDAVRDHLIPAEVSAQQARLTYADEADLLNVALFGFTAAEWRAAHPERKRNENVRDEADVEQLMVLSNLESINALLIRQGLPQSERLVLLNLAAITQMTSLLANDSVKKLMGGQADVSEGVLPAARAL